MRSLEEVFLALVGRVLEIWGEMERNGEADWVLGEAGRYAFKYDSPYTAPRLSVDTSESLQDFPNGTGAELR